MIDFYDIEIRFLHVGPEEWASLAGHAPATIRPLRARIHPRDDSWMASQKALVLSDHFRLRVCPPKVLGRWNTHGTNDLRKAIYETAPAVLKAMGLKVTASVRKSLKAGEYVVREVHVTEQFHLPNHGTTDFLTQLRKRLIDSHRVERLSPGEGFRIDSRSRRYEYLFYDKHVEIQNKAMKRYAERIEALTSDKGAGFPAVGLMIDRALQLYLAALGPRLEVRFGDQFFRGHLLSKGEVWQFETAKKLFRDATDRLRLPKVVRATWARRTARRRLAHQDFQTFLLWAQGESLEVAAGSPKTIARRVKAILAALGVDIRSPASAVLGNRHSVDPSKVFAWSNRVKVQDIDLDRDLGTLGEHGIRLG